MASDESELEYFQIISPARINVSDDVTTRTIDL